MNSLVFIIPGQDVLVPNVHVCRGWYVAAVAILQVDGTQKSAVPHIVISRILMPAPCGGRLVFGMVPAELGAWSFACFSSFPVILLLVHLCTAMIKEFYWGHRRALLDPLRSSEDLLAWLSHQPAGRGLDSHSGAVHVRHQRMSTT